MTYNERSQTFALKLHPSLKKKKKKKTSRRSRNQQPPVREDVVAGVAAGAEDDADWTVFSDFHEITHIVIRGTHVVVYRQDNKRMVHRRWKKVVEE